MIIEDDQINNLNQMIMRKNFTVKKMIFAMGVLLLPSLTYSQVDITFKVDMTGVDMTNATGVYITGQFTDPWIFQEMTLEANNIYSITLSLPEGEIYYYYYKIAADWESSTRETWPIPAPCGSDGTEKEGGWEGDRVITVPSASEALATVPYGGCSETTAIPKIEKTLKSVMVVDGGIKVAGNGKVTVYTIDGRKINQKSIAGTDKISCSKGIYIIKVGNNVSKVIVK